MFKLDLSIGQVWITSKFTNTSILRIGQQYMKPDYFKIDWPYHFSLEKSIQVQGEKYGNLYVPAKTK